MPDGSGPLDRQQALDLVERSTDAGWHAGMTSTPDGQAILNGLADSLSEASDSVTRQVAACSIADAPTGNAGQSNIYLRRTILTTSAIVPKGFKFQDSRGVELVVPLDVVISVGQAQFALPLVTLRQVDLVDNPLPAFDDLLAPGDLADLVVSTDSAPVLDSGSNPLIPGAATYVSSDPIVGAEMDWLSAHGDERGCRRQPGEDGEAYRLRVREIPDAASPVCVQRAAHGAQAQGTLPTVYMREPYRDQARDNARLAIDLIFADSYFAGIDFCDDPIGIDIPGKLPLRRIECVGRKEARAFFQQSVVGDLVEKDDASCHSDVAFTDDAKWGFPDQGLPPDLLSALRAIEDGARVKKAGGVRFSTYVENGSLLTANVEVTAAAGGTSAWVLTPASGTAWMLREGMLGANVGGSLDPTTDSYRVLITLISGPVLDSGWSSSIGGMPLRLFELEQIGYCKELVVSIEAQARSTVSATMRVAGAFWTTVLKL